MIDKIILASSFIFESQDNESEKLKGDMEYTYDEMKQFLGEVINYMDETNDRLSYISIPHDRNSSLQIHKFKTQLLPEFEEINKVYSAENPLYYVWNYTEKGGNYKGSNRHNINEILDIAKANPGLIQSIKVSFTSDKQRKFNSDMSSGAYGPLD